MSTDSENKSLLEILGSWGLSLLDDMYNSSNDLPLFIFLTSGFHNVDHVPDFVRRGMNL